MQIVSALKVKIMGMVLVLTTMVCAVGVINCSSYSKITISRIRMDITRVRGEILRNRMYLKKLTDKRLGKSGFYYVIDSEGVLVFHPQTMLIGRSFMEYWFIENILKARDGCLTYEIGDKTQTIYFRPLNDTEILCLSIMTDDIVDSSVECATAPAPPKSNDDEQQPSSQDEEEQ